MTTYVKLRRIAASALRMRPTPVLTTYVYNPRADYCRTSTFGDESHINKVVKHSNKTHHTSTEPIRDKAVHAVSIRLE
eukprot:2386313-Pyramimonas_sp.AAC.2